MMMRHLTEERLNDYVDELLSVQEITEVERHLADCNDCREAVESTRSLLRQASDLPDLPPARDLLPGIRSATRRRGFAPYRWGALAASLAIVAAASIGTLVMQRQAAPAATAAFAEPAMATPGGDAMEELRQAEIQFAQAAKVLLETLKARRDELPAEALAALESNLTLIDESIDDVRRSLDSGGRDAQSEHALATLYHQKMRLLWKASRLSS